MQHTHKHTVKFPMMKGADAIYFVDGTPTTVYPRTMNQVNAFDGGVIVATYDDCRNLITKRTYPWHVIRWFDEDVNYPEDDEKFKQWFEQEHGMSITDYNDMLNKSQAIQAKTMVDDFLNGFMND